MNLARHLLAFFAVTSGAALVIAGCAGEESDDPCAAAGLDWQPARKTEYESLPEPGTAECVDYNGCQWAGTFAACYSGQPKTMDWVQSHNIVAVFPTFQDLRLHQLCLRQGSRTIVATVYDTCNDADCNGCCTDSKADLPTLIDVEKHTAERFGATDDEPIEWADLGPAPGSPCD